MSGSQDTIFALSSGSLPSGVAVIRVSGPRVQQLLLGMCGTIPTPRYATLRSIRDQSGRVLDQGIILYFPGPNSFTGEDSAEFQVHGGRAVIAALLSELGAYTGLRHAEAGEFSRRAFDHGRLDLVETEGLADLIAADTEMQRQLAMEQAAGGRSKLYQSWATRLTHARAMIEAELDFADEEDVPGAVSESMWSEIAAVQAEIGEHLVRSAAGEIIRDGFRVVIAGRPNAGKSSLLNALAGRDVAIVTAIAGTTRDTIEVDLNLGGYLVRMMDTAGLRETEDIVESEGIRRAITALETAHLVLVLREAGDSVAYPDVVTDAEILYVQTKSDLPSAGGNEVHHGLAISVNTSKGLDSLTKRIAHIVEKKAGSGQAMPARARHAELLSQVAAVLQNMLSERRAELEIRAESLREAAHILGRITGKVDVEDLLGVIFSEFCIGK